MEKKNKKLAKSNVPPSRRGYGEWVSEGIDKWFLVGSKYPATMLKPSLKMIKVNRRCKLNSSLLTSRLFKSVVPHRWSLDRSQFALMLLSARRYKASTSYRTPFTLGQFTAARLACLDFVLINTAMLIDKKS